jgi:predicted protein tyrosine phosphatase
VEGHTPDDTKRKKRAQTRKERLSRHSLTHSLCGTEATEQRGWAAAATVAAAMPTEDMPAGVAARRDYHEEGKKLVASLGQNAHIHGYRSMDPIYTDQETGGKIFVGNDSAARAADQHAERITHVVNCTEELKNYCASNRSMRYLRLNISYWQSCGDSRAPLPTTDAKVMAWLEDTLFPFVDGCLAKGENVLVHCLAGAHRAGTTGVLLLMQKTGMPAAEATKAAKVLRPAINPIGDFPLLLQRFERHRRGHRQSEEGS